MLPGNEELPALKKLGLEASNKRKVCGGRGTTEEGLPTS